MNFYLRTDLKYNNMKNPFVNEHDQPNILGWILVSLIFSLVFGSVGYLIYFVFFSGNFNK